MERRRCYHCARDYAVIKDDATRSYNPSSPWLDDVCKRCACFLRGYHTWTVTDSGTRICAACFLRRFPLEKSVRLAIARQKRELAHKKVHKVNESP